MKQLYFFAICLSLFFVSCYDTNGIEFTELEVQMDTVPFVVTPDASMKMEVENFETDNETNDTLYSKTGSVIVLPKNSMQDEFGNKVKGKIKVTYREFSVPSNYSISGIPIFANPNQLDKDSVLIEICEIRAFQGKKEIHLDANSKWDLNVSNNEKNSSYSFLYRNEVNKNWQFKREGLVYELSSTSYSCMNPNLQALIEYVGNTESKNGNLMIPKLVQKEERVIDVKFDASEFPELAIYKNLKFEIDSSEKNFSANDAKEKWNETKINRVFPPDLFLLQFSNSNRKVSYLAHPVIEAKDYTAAQKTFETKKDERNNLFKRELSSENKKMDASIKSKKKIKIVVAKTKENMC